MKDSVRSKDMTVAVYNCIREIPQKEWDALVDYRMCCTSAWLGLFEESIQEDILPYYITVSRGTDLVGGAVCYKTKRKLLKVSIPYIACMVPFSEEKFFIKKGETSKTMSVLFNALERTARNEKALMIFVPYLSGESLTFFKEKGCTLMKTAPLAQLNVQWKTFNEFLGSLTRKSKKSIRHVLNQGKRRGLTLEHSHDFSDADNLFSIYMDNLERHHYEHTIPFTRDLFRNFEKYVGDQVYVLRCFLEDDLLGYWIYFFDGTHANMALSGIDYSYPREYDAYFNICYDGVREMIEKGCTLIEFGSTTYEVKRRIGCSMKQTSAAVKGMNPLLNIGYKPLALLQNMRMERDYPE